MKINLVLPKFSSLNKTRGIGVYASNLKKNLPQNILSNSTADVTHFLNFDLFFLSLPLSKTSKWVVTVHDVIPLIFPAQFPKGIRGQAKLFLQKVNLARADAIITDSQNSKKDIVKHLHIPANRIHVIHLGVDKSFTPLNIDKKPFVLYVGDINYNKNISVLVEAFALLNRQDIKLVLASRVWKQSIPEVIKIKQQINDLGITSQVDYNTRPNLPHLYNQALLYIQPSLYEGFGLPLLEAMACGIPVVSTNTASLPEICGNAAIIVKPTVQDLASGMQEGLALSSKQLKSYARAGIVQAAKFTWEKTAKETIEVYNKVLAKR